MPSATRDGAAHTELARRRWPGPLGRGRAARSGRASAHAGAMRTRGCRGRRRAGARRRTSCRRRRGGPRHCGPGRGWTIRCSQRDAGRARTHTGGHNARYDQPPAAAANPGSHLVPPFSTAAAQCDRLVSDTSLGSQTADSPRRRSQRTLTCIRVPDCVRPGPLAAPNISSASRESSIGFAQSAHQGAYRPPHKVVGRERGYAQNSLSAACSTASARFSGPGGRQRACERDARLRDQAGGRF